MCLAILVSLAAAAPAFAGSSALWKQAVPLVRLAQPAPANVTPLANPVVALPARHLSAQPSLPARSAAIPFSDQRRRPIQLAALLGLLWLAGFAVSLLRFGFGLARLSQIKKAADFVGVRVTRRGPVRVLA